VIELAITAGLFVVGLTALAGGFRPTGGTTFRAVWWWAIVALLAVAASEAAAVLPAQQSAAAAQSIRFIAGIATLCPLIALLGAKRPQDRAWQFVVAAFWCTLALPALQNLVLHPDAPLTVHPVWSWFMAAGILFGLTNYLPTRYFFAAVFAAGGQWVLLAPQLPGRFLVGTQRTALVGFGLIVAALAMAAWLCARRSRSSEPLDRLWLDFRDEFGVVWSLRIAERLNASAVMQQAGAKLAWHGFTLSEATAGKNTVPPGLLKLPTSTCAEVERSFRSLLLRFVPNHWIESRVQCGSTLSRRDT
jgi:hypothetical protein